MIILTTGKPGEGMTLQLRNSHQWRAVGEFLDAQWLASLGLGLVVVKSAASVRLSESEAASRMMQREALPVGNTGITLLLELANV